MSSLAELRRKLCNIQLKSSKITLCQSECVDILLKISSFRGLNLYSTNDGMFLLTPKQIELEIIKILENEGGRSDLLYITKSCDVSFNIIEKTLSKILHESPYTYYIENGVLMNTTYLNNVIDSINFKVKELGMVKLTDLSAEFNLSTAFLSKIFSNHALNKLEGFVKKTHIENDFYRMILEKSLTGALVATFNKVLISYLASLSRCDDDSANAIIEKIISNNKNIGIIRSNYFIPNSYIIDNQRDIINFFASNGYISKSRYNEFALPNCLDEYSKIITNSISLNTVLVSKIYHDQLKILINDVINNSLWNTLDDTLTSLSSIDIQMLIKLSTNINIETEYRDNSSVLLFQDNIFISQKYLSNLIMIASHYIFNIFKSDQGDNILILPFVNYTKIIADARSDVTTLKKKKKSKRDLSLALASISNCDIQNCDVEKVLYSLISASDDIISNIIVEDLNINDFLHESEYSFTNLWNIIYDHSEFSSIILQDLIKCFNKLYQENYVNSSKVDRTLELSELVESYYNLFHYSYKGLQFINVSDWNNPISIYICKSILMNILELLLEIYQLKFNFPFGDLGDKKSAIDKLSKHYSDKKNLVWFYEAIISRNLDNVMGVCYEAAEDVFENIRIPSKKNEKEYITNKIKQIKMDAKNIPKDDHLSILHICINNVLLINGHYIEFPAQVWSIKYMINQLSCCKKLKCNIVNDIINHFNLYIQLKEQQNTFTEDKKKELERLTELLLSFINK